MAIEELARGDGVRSRCRGMQRHFRDERLAAVVRDAESLSRLLREAGKRAYAHAPRARLSLPKLRPD